MADYVIFTQDKAADAKALSDESGLSRVMMMHGEGECYIGRVPDPRPFGWYYMARERSQ